MNPDLSNGKILQTREDLLKDLNRKIENMVNDYAKAGASPESFFGAGIKMQEILKSKDIRKDLEILPENALKMMVEVAYLGFSTLGIHTKIRKTKSNKEEE